MKTTMIIGMLAGVVLMAGCGKETEVNTASTLEFSPVFVSEPIGSEPTPIPEARKTQAGKKVVLSGLVMGVNHPFVEGRAVFVLGDEGSLEPCDVKGDDHCPTPWDNCCDPVEVKQAGTVTIQILDEGGKPFNAGLRGEGGLKELSRVTVSGIVDKRSSPAAFIVNASAIHVTER